MELYAGLLSKGLFEQVNITWDPDIICYLHAHNLQMFSKL